jgi:opacity protein-like surface antigen
LFNEEDFFMKKQLCAVALLATTALTATAQADEFTYLSAGLSFNTQGTLANINKKSNDCASLSDSQKDALKQKTNSAGFYLNGSVDFGNQMFVEGRLHHSRLLQQNLLGVGFHYPITQPVVVYVLAGVSQRSVALQENTLLSIKNDLGEEVSYKKIKESTTNYSDSFRPTIELGLKAQFNEVAGVRAAYRFAQFKIKKDYLLGVMQKKDKVSKNLHESHVGGYYKISDNLAAEAGYTYTVSLKGAVIKDKSSKDHAGTIGLRYTF